MVKFLICGILLVMVPLTSMAKDQKQIIVGYVENVSIPLLDLTLKAKLDTGATTSSIHAEIIEIQDKAAKDEAEDTADEDEDEAKKYVTFTIINTENETKNLKKEIVRYVRIKLKDGELERRPVVMMKFCVAGQMVEEEVNLSNRDHFNYDVLVGRNMLIKGNLLIDSSKTFTAKPNCTVTTEDDENGE